METESPKRKFKDEKFERHYRLALNAVTKSDSPPRMNGRAIVIGVTESPHDASAFILLRRLRQLGSRLPVIIYCFSEPMRTSIKNRIRWIDKDVMVVNRPGHSVLTGVKLLPIINNPYREVLYLDAQNFPVKNPDLLFEMDEYKETGAVLWPEGKEIDPYSPVWPLLDLSYTPLPGTSSGQFLFDKERCWKALFLARHLNIYRDFWHQYTGGQRNTFSLAFLRTATPFAMPDPQPACGEGYISQYDFDGELLFQHRNENPFLLGQPNKRLIGFFNEKSCFLALAEIENPDEQTISEIVENGTYMYVRAGYDSRILHFLNTGMFSDDSSETENVWFVKRKRLHILGKNGKTTTIMRRDDNGVWHGRWHIGEKMVVVLVPFKKSS